MDNLLLLINDYSNQLDEKICGICGSDLVGIEFTDIIKTNNDKSLNEIINMVLISVSNKLYHKKCYENFKLDRKCENCQFDIKNVRNCKIADSKKYHIVCYENIINEKESKENKLTLDFEEEKIKKGKIINLKSLNKQKSTIPEINQLNGYITDIRLSKIKESENSEKYNIYYHGVPNINTIILYSNNQIILKLIDQTNIVNPNIANYYALLTGLYISKYLKIKNIELKGSNQLIINQLNGLFKVKDDTIKIYYDYAKKLMKNFDTININYEQPYRMTEINQYIETYKNLPNRCLKINV
jgi:hypothetical protein